MTDLLPNALVAHAIQSLLHTVERASPASVRLLERAVSDVAQAQWSKPDRWPAAFRRIMKVADSDAWQDPKTLDKAIADAGKIMAGLNDGVEDDLATAVGRAWGVGYKDAVASTKKVKRAEDDATTPAPADILDGTPLYKYVDPIAPFSVLDVRAVEWLGRDVNFWIRDAWDNQLGGQIAMTAAAAIRRAASKKDLVEDLKAQLGSRFNEPDHYWNVVAGAAVTRARSYGSVGGMRAAGVTSFRFRAMMDQRTSPICRELNGKIFTIDQGESHISAVSESEGQGVKDVAPWLPASEIEGKDTAALAAMGVMLPPLHGNCRSEVVAESFAPIS